MVTLCGSGFILYLVLSLCSLIVIHWWLLPINFYSYFDSGDTVDRSSPSSSSLNGVVSSGNGGQFLTCDHLKEITKVSIIGEGAVKTVWLAKWRQQLITLSELKFKDYQEDFNHNRLMLQQLADSGRVVKLLGSCNDTLIMTQFHPFGNPLNLQIWNRLRPYPIITRTEDCFKLCLQFVDLINYFHTHPSGPLVLCDSNSLAKLLSQLLISIVTKVDEDDLLIVEGLKLIANDLDALPNVRLNNGTIKCGSRQLEGDFVAPEQLWPYPNEPFNDTLMPPYNEKIDIWKIPDVCSWFIKLSSNGQQLIDSLTILHNQCKQPDPNLRPNSSTVYQEYLKVYQQLRQNDVSST